MVLGTVFFINCNCLRAFASSVFFSYCDRFGLSLFPLVPSAFSEKILFWDQVRYFGRPFYFGRTRGSWHPALPGSPQGGSGRPPVGPVAAVVPSNYSFTDVNPGSHLFKCERFTFLLYLPADP